MKKLICIALCLLLVLIYPGIVTDLIGLGLVAIVAVAQVIQKKNAPAAL